MAMLYQTELERRAVLRWATWTRTRNSGTKDPPVAYYPTAQREPVTGLEPIACPLQEGCSACMS